MAEVGLRRGLDPVGAVAEVDRVQVGREDLVLGPLVGELIGERSLPELLEDRAVRLGLEGVLDELLLDRGGTLDAAFVQDVLDEGAGDAADVDAAVRVEALVLDRDHGLLGDAGDLIGGHDHAVLLAEDADRLAEIVEQDRAAGVLELGEAGQRRQVRGDRDEHPEHEGDQPQQQHREHDREQPQALDGAASGRAALCRV